MIAAQAKEPGKAKAEVPGQKAKQQPASPKEPAFNPLWERLALGVQAKLTVSAPDDPYEREADQVAERVMRMPAPQVQRTGAAPCPQCEEQQRLQRKPAAPHIASAGSEAAALPLGAGQPLEPSVRRFFEPRMGADLAGVRVHTSGAAAAAAKGVDALAFTVGRDIVFGADEYRPESPEGRKLLAHELTHTVQQRGGEASTLRRKPRRFPDNDPIHQPILEQYRREEGLPESGIDPLTGRPVGPSPAAIKYGPWPGDVATPASKPSLAAVPEALPLASCGKVTPGMDPAKADPIIDCITHARFVNFMNQSIANMAQVASPYAPGIAATYQAVLAQVVKAGLSSPPTAKAPKTFTINNFTVVVSPGVTLPIASFDLTLQRNMRGPNGAHTGSGIELNEESRAAWLQDQADIERTMYHEGFHWLSGEVSAHNRQVRGGAAGSIVRPELDFTFVNIYETELRAAAEPIWKDILAQVPLQASLPKTLTPQALSGIQWIKISNEILSRVEEAVYLNLRQGKGFSRRFDLPNLPQDWLLTSDYWDSGVIFIRADLQSFLKTNTDRINRELLPVVQKIQREYLRRRATP